MMAGIIDCSDLGNVKIEGENFNRCLDWLIEHGYKEDIAKWRADRKKFEPPKPQACLPGEVNPEKDDVLVYLGTEIASTWQKQTYFVNSPEYGIYLGTAKYKQDGGRLLAG